MEDNYREGKTEIRIRLKPAAHTLGLTLSDVGLQMRHGWYGDEPVRIQRGRDDIRIKVRYPASERKSLKDLMDVRIRTPSGAEVPFDTVAKVTFEKGVSMINRRDGKRVVAVTANVNKEIANADEIMRDLIANFVPGLLERHPGTTFTVEGQQNETAESMTSLFKGFLFAVFAIYLVLATIFRSYLQPVIILVTVPFGVIGAVLGHMVMDLDITMTSLFGMVALTGIVVNDAIVLMECVNQRIKEGMPVFPALAEGGARRFRAIILTTITTTVGLLPLIVERSVQAQYLIPMAVAITCGVFLASMLTLVLVPCLMGILNDLRIGFRRFLSGRPIPRERVEPSWNRREIEARVKDAGEV